MSCNVFGILWHVAVIGLFSLQVLLLVPRTSDNLFFHRIFKVIKELVSYYLLVFSAKKIICSCPKNLANAKLRVYARGQK